MKKIILTSLTLIIGLGLMAQRSVDWQVSEVLSPTSLNTNPNGSTTINLHWVLKNNGPDSVEATDSIYYSMIITQTNNVYITSFPTNPAQITFFRTANKVMKTGDTVHLRRSLTTNLGVTNSGNIRFVANSEIRKTTLTESNIQNNANIISPMIWFNRQNNGVSVESISNNTGISVLGNPSKDKINVDLNVRDNNNSIVITLTDLTGKILKTSEFSNADVLSLDIADIATGNYILTVRNGDLSFNEKVTVVQ